VSSKSRKPDADDAAHALDQAVAYAAALDALLGRSSKYRMLCGYPQYPPKLEATAVVQTTTRSVATSLPPGNDLRNAAAPSTFNCRRSSTSGRTRRAGDGSASPIRSAN